jgi:hypothetical protein
MELPPGRAPSRTPQAEPEFAVREAGAEKLVGQLLGRMTGPPSAPGGTVMVMPPATSVPPPLSMVALLVTAVRHTPKLCVGFETAGQLSQTSPILSPSLSR